MNQGQREHVLGTHLGRLRFSGLVAFGGCLSDMWSSFLTWQSTHNNNCHRGFLGTVKKVRGRISPFRLLYCAVGPKTDSGADIPSFSGRAGRCTGVGLPHAVVG